MKFKVGDKVHYKNDKIKTPYRVYAIYSKNFVSLGLKDYPDVEQDNQTNIKDIEKK